MAGQQKPTGSLTIKLIGASGKDDGANPLWDSTFSQGFVKVELRGPTRHVKAASSMRKVSDFSIDWNEELEVEVLADANELRIMLCKEKRYQNRKGADVVAACGLFIAPLLEAVPINKVFDMYKPGGAGPGGSIRIFADFEEFEEDKNWDTHTGHLPALAEESGGDSSRRSGAADNEGLQPPTPKKEEQTGDEASSREPLVERPLNISRATSAYHGAILAPEPSAPSAPEPEDPPPPQGQQPADEGTGPGSSSVKPDPASSPAAAAPSQPGAGADSGPAAGKQAVAWTSHGEKASEPASKLQPEPTKAKPAGLPRASHAPARQRSPTRRPAKRGKGGPFKLFAAAAVTAAVIVVAKQVSAKRS